MDWMGKSNKAIAFLRVSSKRQEDSTSHETQEQEIVIYCQKHGLELVKTVRMVESAKDSGSRKSYREGMDWALANKVRHVVFYIFDRETRNLTDNERNEDLVRENRIVLHYPRENRMYHAKSSDSDFMLRDFHAVTNKQYSRALSTKVLDGMRTKAERGVYPGHRPPLGYVHRRLVNENGHDRRQGTVIIPDPNEKKVRQVQREFELRAQGHSAEQIRKLIIDEGFVSSARARAYGKSEVEQRLRNPFYSGKFLWQGKEYQGTHELIIPRNILRDVALSFAGRSYLRRPSGEHGILAGGWLSCADEACGCNIVYDPKTKKLKTTGEFRTYHYYCCSNGRRAHEGRRNVTEEHLWSGLGRAVDDITLTDEIAERIAEILNRKHEKIREARARDLQGYKDALVALEHEEDQAYDLLQAKTIDGATYKRQIEKLRAKRDEYTNLHARVNAAIDGKYLETAKSILELAKNARKLWESRSAGERLAFLKLILSNQKLNGVTVEYVLKKPYSTLKLLKSGNDWSSGVDAFRTELLMLAA